MRSLIIAIGIMLSIGLQAQNTPPTLEILTWDATGQNVTIKYSLIDADNDPATIEIRAYQKINGSFKSLNTANATGDVGNNISPGIKSISWVNSNNTGEVYVDLIADDGKIVNIQDLVDQVDTNLLKSNLQWIEGTRHKTAGVMHLQETRDSIANFFLNNQIDTAQHHFKFGNVQALNIIGNKYGAKNRQRIYLNDAHYDSIAGGPGADDNASGVAGFMEVARILSKYKFENTLRFIGFDLEEDGLIGSGAYVKNYVSPNDSIKGVLNFEMIGYYSDKNNTQTAPPLFDLVFPAAYALLVADTFKGNFITNIADFNSKPLADAFIANASQYVPELKVITLSVPDKGKTIPDLRRSDHANFWDKNIEALMLTDGADFRNKSYHTANDKSSILNMNFMGNVVKASLATLATLAKPLSGDVESILIKYTVSVKEPVTNNLVVSPNPVNNNLSIEIPGNEIPVSINIIDLSGRLIYYEKLTSNDTKVNLNFSNRPAGSYVVLLKTTNASYTAKVLKY